MNTYMHPPAITPEVERRAYEVQNHAVSRRETLVIFNNRLATGTPGPRDDEKHHLVVPIGYRVVYSVVQDTTGWNQVFEISVTQPKMSPSPGAVARLLALFGIETKDEQHVFKQAKSVQELAISPTTTAVVLTFPFNFYDWNKRTPGAAEPARA